MEIQFSEELAYWIGVAQSDGTLQRYRDKNKENTGVSIRFHVAESSLPMLVKFQELSKKLFDRNAKIFKLKTRELWGYHIGIKGLLKLFTDLNIKFGDPPISPEWSIGNPKFFGAYLAGLIDGDGDIRIKRKKYPQCVIRISSGLRQKRLSRVIMSKLKCSALITKRHRKTYSKKLERTIEGTWFVLEFLISSKNVTFIKNYILPFLQLDYKRKKIEYYINSKSFSI